jgi:L-threonylcarbamoyladenylate synthase
MALTMKVSLAEPEDAPLVLAAEVIEAGGVVVYPTETLYGIGAHALNEKAVKRVQMVKGRGEGKPILIIVPSADWVARLARDVPPVAQSLIDAFWPGPLTLIFSAAQVLPEELTQGTSTIGIRVPSSPLCLKLLKLSGHPITSTSANLSGAPVLHSIPEIKAVFSSGVDLYLDGGTLPGSTPSTIVDVTAPQPKLVRNGAVPLARIRAIVPNLQVS